MAFDTQQNLATRKIGRNKGKPRLWLEGAILSGVGLDHAQRYVIEHCDDGFYITRDRDGKRKVSGKASRPVIDISATGLGVVATAQTVTVYQFAGFGLKVEVAT